MIPMSLKIIFNPERLYMNSNLYVNIYVYIILFKYLIKYIVSEKKVEK
jgi:hypothetical protein